MKTVRDFFIGTFIGFILGGLLGLLLAPKSGAENRQMISQKYTEAAEKIEQAMQEDQEKLKKELDTFSK